MILVIGECADTSTDYFMEWADYFATPVVRINKEDAGPVLGSLQLNNGGIAVTLSLNGREHTMDEIDAVWFRRGYIDHTPSSSPGCLPEAYPGIIHYLENENECLSAFLVWLLRQKHSLGHPARYNANKLITLSLASSLGFRIPDTLITQSRMEVAQFCDMHPGVLTKSIQDALFIMVNGKRCSPNVYPFKVKEQEIPERFWYSAFQQQIRKKYELRIFFLGNRFWASAIFTYEDPGPAGYRQGGGQQRVVPFVLPAEITDRLHRLNVQGGYETGSIDMLVDEEDRYYFLEINPVGQYDYVSRHCNYHLDLRVLEFLTSKHHA